jgi:hypothetical protein
MTCRAISKNTSRVKIERGSPDSIFVSKLARVKLDLAERENEDAKKDLSFKQSIEKTLATGGRSSYIQICAPFELYALTRLLKPKHIVEVGVSAGVSTAYLLHGLQMNGQGGILHSIDLPEIETEGGFRKISWALPPGKKTGWAVPNSLKRDWDLRLGRSSEILPQLLEEINRVDLFLYDTPYEIEEAIGDFGAVDRRFAKGSVALADNCLVPLNWWAKKRKAKIYKRKNSGLRGFNVP